MENLSKRGYISYDRVMEGKDKKERESGIVGITEQDKFMCNKLKLQIISGL